MSDIPSNVFRKILLQLPAESLFRFRCVCKEWRRIIDDPSFTRSHANGQHSSTTLLIRTAIGTPIFYLSLDSLRFVNGRQIIDATRVKTIMKRDVPRLPVLPAALCNGLILISHFEINKIWVVWNPLTRELHELPQPDIDMHIVGSGIGYDFATEDYKVVRIDRLEFAYRTHIYSLKLESWKMIKNCPVDFPPSTTGWDQGVYLNGALHWRSRAMITVLDLETESYRQIAVPTVPNEPLSNICLDALSGHLILSFSNSLTRFDMWLLKEYGAEESWMKLFSVGSWSYAGDLWGMRPIAYLKNKDQVILQNDSTFLWLDIKKSITKKFTIRDFPNQYFTCQICPGSLLHLEDSCDGQVAEKTTAGAKRKRKQKNDRRLKFSITVASTKYRLRSDCASDSTWLRYDDEDY